MINERWFSTTACGYVDKSRKVIHNLGRRGTSAGEAHRQMIHFDEVVCQMVCHIDLAPELYNVNGATFGATFLQRSYNREGSYEL